MAGPLPITAPCPVCGSRPDIGSCEPWPKDEGKAPWYAVCYRMQPREHCVCVNGDNQRDVMVNWNREALKLVGAQKTE